ncbi:uncharacterized protein LOC133793953 [Humulus lupulus]|uniref:uncharacterized protein LOC133793953 n=1 Tax=Humulus lupulus TaxID=3486 RepID=UPI002B4034B3|nr:uncharacterized protein LOC133793953 [Humulus lupulus]
MIMKSKFSLVIVVVLVVVMPPPMAKAVTPSECKEERRQLVNECRPMIFGENPSSDCCECLRVVHVECVCPNLTPKIAILINVQRTAKQIRSCGRNYPHNLKCGTGKK